VISLSPVTDSYFLRSRGLIIGLSSSQVLTPYYRLVSRSITFLKKTVVVEINTRSSATAKSTARPSCLVGVLLTFIGRQTTDQQLINHFCMKVATKPTEFREITQNNGHYNVTTFKVVQGHRFCYQSKAHIRLPISH